ncbi:unnamed protein product [Euphydryas editha]|uniref:Endonuclease/exonuclease/phosphatase domain-containing protein n=1 Tax=Euphydryas editha TaxID=104508 RepID=A0AAU9TZ07_EUPED|nr:unnamed protein product [Euphydryas editha]
MTSGFHNKIDGGGVLIAFSRHLRFYRLQSFESHCGDIWIGLEIGNKGNISPPIQKHVLKEFIDNTNKVLQSFVGTSLVVGDFNLGGMSWFMNTKNCSTISNSILHAMLSDFLSLDDLTQYNFVYNNKNKILDLLSNKSIIDLCDCLDALISIDVLHSPLTFSLNVEPVLVGIAWH